MLGSLARVFSAAVLAVGLVPVWKSVAEETPQTSISPNLERALTLWLADRDAQALPLLSTLAAKGDTTAGLFLSLVERTELGASDFVNALTREDYLSIYRAPGGEGLFRKTWIDTLAGQGHDLAGLIKRSWQPTPALEQVQALLSRGEPGIAMIGIRYIGLYGSSEERAALLDSGDDLQGMRPFLRSQQFDPAPGLQGMEVLRDIVAQTSGKEVPPDDPDALALAPYLSFGFPFGYVDQDNRWRSEMIEWVSKDPVVQPVASFCRAFCEAEVGVCSLSVLGLIGGYYEAIRFASPMRALISPNDYVQSPRSKNMILRRLTAFENEIGDGLLASVPDIARQSQCVGDLVDRHRNDGGE